MVAKWAKTGIDLENLRLLLGHELPAVQLAAAAYLISQGEQAEAVPVLLRLTRDSQGLIAPSAAAVLRVHKLQEPLPK